MSKSLTLKDAHKRIQKLEKKVDELQKMFAFLVEELGKPEEEIVWEIHPYE